MARRWAAGRAAETVEANRDSLRPLLAVIGKIPLKDSAKFATPTSLGFVETVFLGISVRGVPTEVRPASSSNPAEDLIVPLGGPVHVSQFYADGMVSAAVNEHHGSELAVQIEYAPYGKPTGLCTAVATTAYQDEPLSLQPCSTPGTTVWILDIADSPAAYPLLPDRQRVGHRLRPPLRDDHPGEPG